MLNNLQVLRGVAALMVVADHWADLHGGLVRQIGLLGSTGVDLFFVVSGFVMVYTTRGAPTTPGKFLINRFIRIAPLYWAVTLAFFFSAVAAPSIFKSTGTDPAFLVKSLLFMPYVNMKGVVQPILFPAWTLNYEMFFYVVFAAGLPIKSVVGRVTLTGMVMAVLALVGLVIQPHNVILAFYTSPLMLEFGYGMVLGLAFPSLRRWLSSRQVAGGVLLVGAVLLLALQPMSTALDRGILLGLPALAVVAAILAMEAHSSVTDSRWLLVGAASYAIYIIHPITVLVLFKLLGALHLQSGSMLLASGALIVAATTLAGIAVHLLFERPVDRWLRQNLTNRDGGRAGVSIALWPWRGDASTRG